MSNKHSPSTIIADNVSRQAHLGKVVAILKRFNLNLGAHLGRQCSLCLFHLSSKFTDSSMVFRHVNVGFSFILLDEIINDTVVKVFTTEMCVTGSCEDFENTVFNG